MAKPDEARSEDMAKHEFGKHIDAEDARKVDVAIFFEGGPNNGMVIYDVDYEDISYALSTYYSDNFFTFSRLNSDIGEDEELIVNLSQIQFIRIKDKK